MATAGKVFPETCTFFPEKRT